MKFILACASLMIVQVLATKLTGLSPGRSLQGDSDKSVDCSRFTFKQTSDCTDLKSLLNCGAWTAFGERCRGKGQGRRSDVLPQTARRGGRSFCGTDNANPNCVARKGRAGPTPTRSVWERVDCSQVTPTPSPADVLEEYNQTENHAYQISGLHGLLDPPVNHFSDRLLRDISDDIACIGIDAAKADLVAECQQVCNSNSDCTTFTTSFASDDTESGCLFLNNNVNEFNRIQIVPTGPSDPISRDVYHKKTEAPILFGEFTEGLFPAIIGAPDFNEHFLPAFSCVASLGGNIETCTNCAIGSIPFTSSCPSIAAQICGVPGTIGGITIVDIFSDAACGTFCHSGATDNYACLPQVQQSALATFNQQSGDVPGIGFAFGCSMSTIANPTTGEALPDYTCLPEPSPTQAPIISEVRQ